MKWHVFFLLLLVPSSEGFAQQIAVALKDPAAARVHIDSANWNEAWIEVDGHAPNTKPFDTSSFHVTEGATEAKMVRVDSIGTRFESSLALSIVLDNSSSMFHNYDSLTKYCDSLVDSPPRGIRLQAVTFDNQNRSDLHLFTKREGVFIAQTGFRDTVAKVTQFWHFFDSVRTRYTPLYDAIGAALENIRSRKEDGDSLRDDVLLVVTDGEDNASRLSIETLMELTSLSQAKLIAVNFRTGEDERLLWLTKKVKGAFYYADDLHDLRDLLHQLGHSMTRYYHITYLFPSLGPSTYHR